MAIDRSVSRGCGYVVTEEGHTAAAEQESCDCVLEWRGGLLGCPNCSTVWTTARGMGAAFTPKQGALDWKYGR
jgi:hypothetical protein